MPEGGFAKLGGFRQMNGFGGFKDECDGTCEHKDEFYKGVVDFPALIKDLDGSKYGSPINDQKFNYELYKGKLDVYNPSPDGLGGVWSKEGAELEYIDSITGRKNKTNLHASLNKVVCCIDTVFNYRIRVSAEKISYGITYHYKDAAGEESLVDHYQDRDRYTIDEKYVAIHIHSENAEDIIQVLKRINRGAFIDDFKKLVGKYFQQALLATTDKADLNELYKKAPLFALEWLAGPGQFTSVMWQEHLPLLLSYDNSGLLSFVRDSSHAVVNLLQGIKDMRFLYDELKKNPGLIKTIYSNMDGSSVFKGADISNRKIFSSLLNAICYHNIDKCTRTGERFYVDDTRKPDSNLNSGNDIYKDKIFLAQLTKRTFKEEIIIDGDDRPNSAGQSFEVPVSRFQPDDGGNYYHPMDMVILQDENGLQVEVTALFVKDIADELEWAEIMEDVRLGINIFAMVVSLATLMAGPGAFLFVLSTIDLALAGSDTVIQGLKDELAKTEEGREFLALWEKVYVIGGIATAGPLVVTGLFSAGARLWAKLSSGAARDFVAAVLTRIVMELKIANFTSNTVRIIDAGEISQLTKNVLSFYPITRLQKEGVIFMTATKVTKQGSTEIILVLYDGELIASGSAEQVRNKIKDIFFLEGAELKKFLAILFDTAPKFRSGYWEAANGNGLRAKWRPQEFIKSGRAQISDLAKSKHSGKKFEALAAEKFAEHDYIIFFRNDLLTYNGAETIGDFDLLTVEFLAEFKETISEGTLISRKLERQLLKYTDESSTKFMNFYKKKVVLVVGELVGVTIRHPGFRRIKKMGVTIIHGIDNIKTLY